MAEGKEELLQLKSQIDATLKREQEALAKKGKTLDVMSWFLGLPTDHRYPAGPPYYVSRFRARGDKPVNRS
jgi:hypothetical protein